MSKGLLPVDRIAQSIYFLRGQKVMLGPDLALLYGVPVGALTQAMKRNAKRFPRDFVFQLTVEEFANLKSQFVISSWGGSRSPSYAFTEQGVAMLSSVLHSDRAVKVNIAIMRAFVKLRETLETNRDLARKFKELETRVGGQQANRWNHRSDSAVDGATEQTSARDRVSRSRESSALSGP